MQKDQCSLIDGYIIDQSIEMMKLTLTISDEEIDRIYNKFAKEIKFTRNQNGGACATKRKRIFAASFLSLIITAVTCGSISNINKVLKTNFSLLDLPNYVNEAYQWATSTKVYKYYDEYSIGSNPTEYMKSFITMPINILKNVHSFYTDYLNPTYYTLTDKICDLFSNTYEQGKFTKILNELLPIIEKIQ